jgi:hypothetical protein
MPHATAIPAMAPVERPPFSMLLLRLGLALDVEDELALVGRGVQVPFHDSVHRDASATGEISVVPLTMVVTEGCTACGPGACASHHFIGMMSQFMPMKAAWRKARPR